MHVLLLAHGSRDPRHAATMRAIAEGLRTGGAGADVTTAVVAYLDHGSPDLVAAVRALPATTEPVAVVPMLLVRAFHARVDVPAEFRTARAARQDLDLRLADVLGPHPLLVAALERRLAEAGVAAGDRSTARVLLAAGTTDEDARAGIAEVAHGWLGPGTPHAFATGPGPSPAEAVATLAARGVRRIAVAPYLLAAGTLGEHAAEQARAATSAARASLVVAPALGAAPEVVDFVLLRAREAQRAGTHTS